MNWISKVEVKASVQAMSVAATPAIFSFCAPARTNYLVSSYTSASRVGNHLKQPIKIHVAICEQVHTGVANHLKQPIKTHVAIREQLHTGVAKWQEGVHQITGVEDEVDSTDRNEFIEIGVIKSTHGVHGELKVVPLTDFPEERFEKPGIRWVQTHKLGNLKIRQVELTEGRSIQGKQPSWLVTFKGIDTPEKATEFVGYTMLVKALDRPMLNDDEFYIPDLVGMSVIMQNSGKVVGEIVDVFTIGASDLLRVKMFLLGNGIDATQKEVETEFLAWIPFVAEIVPTVDKNRRIVKINPPEGLLDLYIQKAPKKVSHKQTLREKRKLQGKVGGVKKRLLALKQGHVLSGLVSDNKFQKDTLLDQLMSIDFKLFQHALESAIMATTRLTANEVSLPPLSAISHLDRKGLQDWINNPARRHTKCEIDGDTLHWWRAGLQLIGENKVAVVALPSRDLNDDDFGFFYYESALKNQAEQLLSIQKLAESPIYGKKPQIPWIVVTTYASEELIKTLFKSEGYFGLNQVQVIFLRQSCLPYVNYNHDILMESPWKIITGSSGEGQIFSDLATSGILETLVDRDICYIQMYSTDNALAKVADPIFFGFTHEKQASIGMKVVTRPLHDKETSILCLQQEASESEIIIPRKINRNTNKQTPEKKHYAVMRYEDFPTEVLYDIQQGSDSDQIATTDTMMLAISENMQLQQRVTYNVTRFYDNIYSVKCVQHLASQTYRLHYDAVLKNIPYVKKVECHFAQTVSDEHNAMQLKCSLHSALTFCTPEEVAILEDNLSDGNSDPEDLSRPKTDLFTS